MSDETMIVCAPISWEAVPGSTVAECGECGQKVWLSPSGVKILGEQVAAPVCVPCGMELMRGDDNVVIQPPTPEQVTEVVQYMTEHLPKQ